MCKEYENLKKQRCLQVVQECAQRKKQARMVRRERYWLFHLHAVAKRLHEELAGAVLASQGNRAGRGGSAGEIFAMEHRERRSKGWGQGIYEEGIEICTGNISSICLPKNTSADYLASLVKGLN